MPIVNIDLDWLNRLLGREFPPGEVSESLEQMGCDVEDVVDIIRSRCPRCAALVEHPIGQEEVKACGTCGHECEDAFQQVGSTTVIRLDLLAARPDLFDVGGLARALRGTLGLAEGLPDFSSKPSGLSLTVDEDVKSEGCYRPYITCAVMTLPQIDDTSLAAIMKLQENLHWGVGRDRKLASIGVYDLDTLQGDIRYRSLHADDEPFVPLGLPGQSMSGRQILESHPKGKVYAHLLQDHERYPVLVDEAGQVLSMPPIINSEETRLKVGTRRVFIDVTGISRAAVVKALDTLVCSLMELGGHLETVRITEPDGSVRETPDLTPGEAAVELDEAKRWLGLPLDEGKLTESLRKMRFDVEPVDNKQGSYRVRYPVYRTDIRHMVDLFEDIAIGYGYDNIEPRLVPSMTVGQARPEELLSERTRQVLIGLGFSEVMSLPLTTEEHQFSRLGLEVPETYVRVSNPKLKAYHVLRAHLLTGLLESLHENRRRPMPLRLFEVDNVVGLAPSAETGTSEERRVTFVEMGREAGYSTIRSVLDALLRELGSGATYRPMESPSFVPGRAATFQGQDGLTGTLGELHPQVLENFGLGMPVGICELTLHRIF